VAAEGNFPADSQRPRGGFEMLQRALVAGNSRARLGFLRPQTWAVEPCAGNLGMTLIGFLPRAALCEFFGSREGPLAFKRNAKTSDGYPRTQPGFE